MNEELNTLLNPESTDFDHLEHKMSKANFITLTLSSLQQWAHATCCIRNV